MTGIQQYNIRLQLLSDNNVIIAKCDGLETEIFMPALIDGRISVVNVVPQRRCNCISTVHLVARTRHGVRILPSDTLSNWKAPSISTKSDERIAEPLAKSTPAPIKQENATKKIRKNAYHTPDKMRNALTEANISLMATMSQNPKRLEFNSTEMGDAISNVRTRSPSLASVNFSIIDNALPVYNSSDMAVFGTPPPFRKRNVNDDNTLPTNLNSPKDFHWRKVITPLRTYARRKHSLNTSTRHLTDKNPNHPIKIQTMPPPVLHKVVRRKRKLIVDQKTLLSPRTFKNQLKTEPMPDRNKHLEQHRIDFRENVYRKTAFELITTLSARSNCVASDLQKQFRKRCVNKGSTTYPKYRKLCATSPLDENNPLVSQLSHRLLNGNIQIETENSFFQQQLEPICTRNENQKSVQTPTNAVQPTSRFMLVSRRSKLTPETPLTKKRHTPRRSLVP